MPSGPRGMSGGVPREMHPFARELARECFHGKLPGPGRSAGSRREKAKITGTGESRREPLGKEREHRPLAILWEKGVSWKALGAWQNVPENHWRLT